MAGCQPAAIVDNLNTSHCICHQRDTKALLSGVCIGGNKTPPTHSPTHPHTHTHTHISTMLHIHTHISVILGLTEFFQIIFIYIYKAVSAVFVTFCLQSLDELESDTEIEYEDEYETRSKCE